MKSLKFLIILSLLFAAGGRAEAAKPLDRLEQEIQSDSDAADSLAGYPENVRQAAMEVAGHPDILWDMERRQQQSQEQFQKLISSYPRQTQEYVYDLSRYPSLVDELVEGGQKSKGQIKDMSKSYPKDVQKAAEELARKNYELLRSVRDLYSTSDRSFGNSLNGLPSSTQSAYRTLLGYPELLKDLAGDRDFTMALGEAYRASPGETRSKIDQLSRTVARQKEEALADYRQTLDSDPAAREELQKSAKSFAREYGYDEDDNYYPPPNDSRTVVNINVNPYPYWSGYPYWYSSPFWRPYPLWWYTGFWGWGSSFYAWGLPSFYYTSWFYGYPRNFYHYPHLAGCYAGYYNRWRGRPYYYSGFNRAVGNWHNRYRNQVNNDLWRNDSYRADRWRQFGKNEEIRRRQGGNSSSIASQQWNDPQQVRSRGRKSNPAAIRGQSSGSGSNQPSVTRSRQQGKVFSTQQRRSFAPATDSHAPRARDTGHDSGEPRARPSLQKSSSPSPSAVGNSSAPSYNSGRSHLSGDSGGHSGSRNSGGSSFSSGSSGGGSRSSFGGGGGGSVAEEEVAEAVAAAKPLILCRIRRRSASRKRSGTFGSFS